MLDLNVHLSDSETHALTTNSVVFLSQSLPRRGHHSVSREARESSEEKYRVYLVPDSEKKKALRCLSVDHDIGPEPNILHTLSPFMFSRTLNGK